ncbi:hypothetical protein [Candidatus Albibeggiatoa sp. nov. NOAA]|uniref:hypothetical protein n=1 Tax=Candidatus Albibeggiatoa sp. nov. NOAA TaxID=3162724 RepID=UPI0032FF9C9A|nr:hypothetical protein [Thiotrichaceae bacterium]
MIKPLQLTNEDGLLLTVRLLRKNDAYGDDDAFIYDKEEPSLEVFDASGFEEEPEIYGYFTGIRFTVGELFVEKIEEGSTISEHFSIWGISEASVILMQNWLVSQLSEEEKSFIDIAWLEKTKLMPTKTSLPAPKSTPYHPNNLFREIEKNLDFEEFEEELEDFDEFDDEEDDRNHFVLQELDAALRALDLAESADNQWKHGGVELRLCVLAAKKQILKAIQLANQD